MADDSSSAAPAPPRSWALFFYEALMGAFAARAFAGGEAGVRSLIGWQRWLGAFSKPPTLPADRFRITPLADAPAHCPAFMIEAASDAAAASAGDGDGASAGAAPPVTVVFLHGGAFVLPAAQELHVPFCGALVERLGAASGRRVRVALVDYPLALARPAGIGPRETLDAVEAVFRLAAAAGGAPGPLVIMGDSAGGGLALALAQRVVASARRGGGGSGGGVSTDAAAAISASAAADAAAAAAAAAAARVASVVLISPWADVALSLAEQMRPLEALCCMLRVEGLAACGRLYCAAEGAGACDLRDPAASPLFGDFAGLPPTTVFVGTHELLLPEGRLLRDKLRAAGVATRYCEATGMPHVFPLLALPDTAGATAQLIAAVDEDLRRAAL